MNLEDAKAKLKSIDQMHLLVYWNELSNDEKFLLLEQIHKLDIETFHKQQVRLKHPPPSSSLSFEPFSDFSSSGSPADVMLGKEALGQGLMGCLIVAGGQGTRLHLNGPKGLFPISVVRKKSLFQLFAEKTLAAGKQIFHPLQLAIMTSPLNHAVTKTYFEAHALFGLKDQQIDLFSQNLLPFLDDSGNLFLEKKYLIAQGPDGNGSALYNFYQQGLFTKWKNLGIEYLNFIMIDNPLADPFDAELIGYHIRNKNDVTVKCTVKLHPEEKVGVLVKHQEKVQVIEYMELPERERHQINKDGSLSYSCANISLFCLTLSFVEKIFSQKNSLPLHPAYKAAPALDDKNKKAWKFEYFIFDMLPLAQKVQALLYPRERCFAPLKNLSGEASPTTVHAALQERDRQIYEELYNKKAPSVPFELAQDFYYPMPVFVDIWKNKSLSNDGYLGGV